MDTSDLRRRASLCCALSHTCMRHCSEGSVFAPLTCPSDRCSVRNFETTFFDQCWHLTGIVKICCSRCCLTCTSGCVWCLPISLPRWLHITIPQDSRMYVYCVLFGQSTRGVPSCSFARSQPMLNPMIARFREPSTPRKHTRPVLPNRRIH